GDPRKHQLWFCHWLAPLQNEHMITRAELPRRSYQDKRSISVLQAIALKTWTFQGLAVRLLAGAQSEFADRIGLPEKPAIQTPKGSRVPDHRAEIPEFRVS
ncbi:MAG TPA: hypothetical protein VIY86_07315, partial [Pirellulaceae bacterium]